jgi:hypothetical protein
MRSELPEIEKSLISEDFLRWRHFQSRDEPRDQNGELVMSPPQCDAVGCRLKRDNLGPALGFKARTISSIMSRPPQRQSVGDSGTDLRQAPIVCSPLSDAEVEGNIVAHLPDGADEDR